MNDFARASLASALVCVFATLAVYTHLMLNKENSAEVAPKATAVAVSRTVEAALPAILSAQDATTYRRIIAAQEKANWKAADALIARLHQRILLGDVLATRYLHRDYTSSPQELSAWLNKYSTLPQATQIQRLALRKGVSAKAAALPPQASSPERMQTAIGNGQVYERFGSGLINRHLRGHPLRERMRQMLIRGNRAGALAMLSQATKLDAASYDLLRWYVANSCFNHGEYGQAAILANASATRSGQQFPALHWIAGLAEWHQGKTAEAYRHFAAMTQAEGTLNAGDRAAAAFWAHRAADALGNQVAAARHLQQAAAYPDTFYGIQAAKALAQEIALTASTKPLTAQQIHRLTRYQTVRRVLALHQIGQTEPAEQELRRFYASTDRQAPYRRHLLTLATKLDMPAAQMQMAMEQQQQGSLTKADYALYPTPQWRQNQAVDPALVYAIARQESGFNSSARSHAGAAGVMQIMPATAQYLLKRARMKQGNLEDAATNIALGQQYIHHLQQQPAIQDNLVYLLAAYNAGTAPLIGWKEQLADKNDPLLFIESIPFAETRNYVLRVLTNYWIYNEIIGKNNASVHAMLEGKWPLSLTGQQQVASTVSHPPHDL